MEMVKFYIVTFEFMNPHSGKDDNNYDDNNKKDRTKTRTAAAAAIPMVGAIVTAAAILTGHE